MVFTIYVFSCFSSSSLIEYRIRLFYKRKKRKNWTMWHTHSNNPVATLRKHWTRPVLFSRGFGRFGDWLYFILFFWVCMVDHALGPFFIPLSFWCCHQNFREKIPPKKNKSDNKQQTQNEITWPEADRFPPISYRIPKFKKDEEEEEVLLLLVQVSLLDSTQLNL